MSAVPLIRSELLTLRSTSTARALLVASMVMAAVSMLANLATFDSTELPLTTTMQQIMHASTVATLTFALVAGIIGATSDFRFGRMDQLLLSQARTSSVLTAKAIVGFGLGMLYGLAGSVIALGVVSLYYRANDVAIDLLSTVILRPLAGAILASALFVSLGLAIGMVVRNQPIALGGGLALLLIVQPPLLLGLPDLGRWLPGAAGLSMTLAPDPALFGQAAGTAVLVGWSVLALAIANHHLDLRRA